jgi:hypothetical protein
MAMKQTFERQPESSFHAAALDRLLGVIGTAWKEAAGAWKERRQKRSVTADDEDKDTLAHLFRYLCRLFPWLNAARSSPVTALKESSSAPLLAMTTISRACGIRLRSRRKNSLTSLLIRLRMTALPTRVVTVMPSRHCPVSLGWLRITK